MLFFSKPTIVILIDLFAIAGYLILAWLLLFLGFYYLHEYKEAKYTANWKWVVLAVDVPPLNVQTPKAVEQMFAQLAGAQASPGIADYYRDGYKQRWFSFEVISIAGYIQFIIRTEEAFRDLVEASLYAQYPEAEITEVEDYVHGVPTVFPNKEYEVWAADFGLAENDAYPIRGYHEFEHSISKDTVLKDPMGAFLESFTRIGPGEQMWCQFLIEPVSSAWKEKAIKKIKEVIGDASAAGGPNKYVDAVLSMPIKLLEGVGDQVFGREASESGLGNSKPAEKNQLKYLTPGQSKVLEAMEEKISYVGFKSKIRAVYIARKEVFRQERGVNLLIGAFNQYNVGISNSIVVKSDVGARYFFSKWIENERKRIFVKAYKKRKIGTGGKPFMLNAVELATIWHFPMSHVKTPQVQTVQAKQTEPPAGLPMEFMVSTSEMVEGMRPQAPAEPEEVGFSTDAYGYDNDMKFG